ncbi:putative quinol monooxygenase [Ralstonia sp. Ralssp135]|uniref:putative quinol monooxygenase n=1 Tax=Ralstonia sp. Ralssp135 TaxID=3243016 RepID=UPI0039AFEF28
MIHVIAAIQAKDGQLESLTAAFRMIVARTREKAGCIEYGLAVHLPSGLPGQAPFDPNELVVIEKWIDLDALNAHISDPEYRAWFAGLWHQVAGASMQILNVVG